ncbi:MAG: MgtC/SapB family protein [Muribaculaceae bacterium]|nr:MgtC/SapB family protein [Muribaculaceae bacterium]
MPEFIFDIWQDILSDEVTTCGSVFKLVLSMLLGCCVGIQRKRKGQPAGVRTFSLICMGATLAMILSIYVPQEYLGLKNGDPGRIAAQVISGVGFLGAGAIIQMKGSVRGLTTAAGIWMVAAIGMGVGVGLYIISIVATVLILIVLVQVERIEHVTSMGADSRIIRIESTVIIPDIEPYRTVLERGGAKLKSFYLTYDYERTITNLNLVVLLREGIDTLKVLDSLEHVFPTRSITLANQLNI